MAEGAPLLREYRVTKPYRGFKSLSLRQNKQTALWRFFVLRSEGMQNPRVSNQLGSLNRQDSRFEHAKRGPQGEHTQCVRINPSIEAKINKPPSGGLMHRIDAFSVALSTTSRKALCGALSSLYCLVRV